MGQAESSYTISENVHENEDMNDLLITLYCRSLPERKFAESLVKKYFDSFADKQVLIGKVSEVNQTTTEKNNLLENENNELRRRISSLKMFMPDAHDLKIKLSQKSGENARLLNAQAKMKLEMENQWNIIQNLEMAHRLELDKNNESRKLISEQQDKIRIMDEKLILSNERYEIFIKFYFISDRCNSLRPSSGLLIFGSAELKSRAVTVRPGRQKSLAVTARPS